MRHGASLRRESDDAELANHIMHDYTKAKLDSQTRGMLDYAAKLTKDPGSMREADVKRLRDLGLSDEQILSAVLITAQFAFMTRLADGLGIDVPAETVEYVEGWLASPARDQQWLMEKHS